MKLTRRQQKAQKTKFNLFCNAVRMFDEKGYDNVTVEDICKASNVSKGTFYVHFDSKEDVLRSSFQSQLSDYLTAQYVTLIENHPDATLCEKLQNQVLSALKFCSIAGVELTTRAFMYNLSMQLNEKKMEQYMQKTIMSSFEGEFFTLISHCFEQNLFKPQFSQQEIYYMVISVLAGCMITWCYSGGKYDIVAVNKSAISYFIQDLFA